MLVGAKLWRTNENIDKNEDNYSILIKYKNKCVFLYLHIIGYGGI